MPSKNFPKVYLTFVLIIMMLSTGLVGQEKALTFGLSGYVKSLQGVAYPRSFGEYLTDNLLHNRLNFDIYYKDRWHFYSALRNRLFWGDVVRITPNYRDQIKAGNIDQWDLSRHWNDNDSWLLNSNLDRLYIEYTGKKLDISIGRQRINWGIALLWNPNDLFNAYNFVDFDYEERPGSDALRVHYYLGAVSHIELVARYARNWDEAILAMRYKTSIKSYDVQVLGGRFRQDYVVGLGWAGNVGNTGFKGESSYFISDDDDSRSALSATISMDYSFDNGLFLTGGILYNSLTIDLDNAFLTNGQGLSAKSLYPYDWSVLVSGQYPVTPLFNAGLSMVYSLDKTHPLFLSPVLTYSLAANWDLDLTGQFFCLKIDKSYVLSQSGMYLRLKWSF